MDMLTEIGKIAGRKLEMFTHKNIEYYKIKDLAYFFNIPEKMINENILEFDDYVLGNDYGVIKDEFVVYFDGFLLLCMTLIGSETCWKIRRLIAKWHLGHFE